MGAWGLRWQLSSSVLGELPKATRRKISPFPANRETEIICRLKIHTRTAKSNLGFHRSARGGKTAKAPVGRGKRDPQQEARLDGKRPCKVPAKIHSLKEGRTQGKKCESLELSKQAKRKQKHPGKAMGEVPG